MRPTRGPARATGPCTDLWELVTQLAAAKGARPAIVSYDGDARVELSATALANWVAKTAGWLMDEAGLQPGGRAAVLLPPTWTAAVCVLGTWAAGGIPDCHTAGTAAPAEPSALFAGAAAAFVAEELAATVPAGLPALAVGRGFTARPSGPGPLPAFPDEVLAMPDDLLDPGAAPGVPAYLTPEGAALDHTAALRAAAGAAGQAGWTSSDVLLLDDLAGDRILAHLAAGLHVGATLIIAHDVPDGAAIVRAERVTHNLRRALESH